jgi:hypothetical protein
MSSQLEPWHMITSFFQYLLLAPSYINVLNVYAVSRLVYFTFLFDLTRCQFANVHDVSWGTKGDNKVSTDLGVVATSKDKSTVEASVPTDQRDINAAYEDAMAILSGFLLTFTVQVIVTDMGGQIRSRRLWIRSVMRRRSRRIITGALGPSKFYVCKSERRADCLWIVCCSRGR